MSARIFISYSRHDSDVARRLESQLNSRGFSAWLDTDRLRMGEFWREEIVQAIEGCDYFLLLLSEHSILSINVVRELSLAESAARRILPVMLHQVEIPDTMKYQLAGLQFVIVDAAHLEQGLHNLLDALPTPLPTPLLTPTPTTAPTPTPADRPPTRASLADPPGAEAGRWDKTRLLSRLTLAIGPMASLLLDSTPDPLQARDVRDLRDLFRRQGIDPEVLDTTLDSSRLAPGRDGRATSIPALPNEEAIARWFRLQVGPIAEVIWDGPLRQALRQKPRQARARLEELGVASSVVDDLLRRCASGSGTNSGQNDNPTRSDHG